MKTFYLILLICFAVGVTIESRSILGKEHTEQVTSEQTSYSACINLTGQIIRDLDKINKTKEQWDVPEMKENRFKLGCCISCLMQLFQLMNGTVLNISKIVDSIELPKHYGANITQDMSDTVASLVTDCGRQVENMTNVCLIGYTFYKCTSNAAEMIQNAHKN